MIIHTVLFYLKPGLSDAPRAEFRAGPELLRSIGTLRALHVGVPAKVCTKPSLEACYGYSSTGIFHDLSGLNAYDSGPVHQALVRRFRNHWERVQIYDAQTSTP